jgi:hypothetical protein
MDSFVRGGEFGTERGKMEEGRWKPRMKDEG